MRHLREATLKSYLAGEIRPSVRVAAESHLAGCRECREVVARVLEAAGAGRTGPGGTDPPSALGDAVRWEITRARGVRRSSARRRGLAVAALAALLAGAIWAAAVRGSPLRDLVVRLFF